MDPAIVAAIISAVSVVIAAIISIMGPRSVTSNSKTETELVGIPHQSPPLTAAMWDRLDPNLQDAFVLAANASRREGKTIISTQRLFAALVRLHPDRLETLFRELPEGSLPQAVDEDTPQDTEALGEIELFSDCVQDSLNNLIPKTTAERRIKAEDMFIDIAKYGTGQSVQRLRTYGVDTERIDELVNQLGWVVLNRA